MKTLSYDETTQEHLFGIPAENSPRLVAYTAALDNYEPVPRAIENGYLVEYDDPMEVSGQPRYMRAPGRSKIPEGSVFLVDDGITCRPCYGGSTNAGNPAPLYPEGSEPKEILYPFPVNPDGKTSADGRVIDYTNWLLGPRKAYLLKVTREA
jgi:hypothetical protein